MFSGLKFHQHCHCCVEIVQTYLESVTSTANKPSIDCMLICFLPIQCAFVPLSVSTMYCTTTVEKLFRLGKQRKWGKSVGKLCKLFFSKFVQFVQALVGNFPRFYPESNHKASQSKLQLKLKCLRDFSIKASYLKLRLLM